MKDENKPFNDVIEHLNKIEGNPANLAKANLNKMPKPLKFFGYFIIIFFSLAFLFMIILSFLK